ncbi:hypothetical protein PUN28_014326 [Cardiocondyla obscurior]|uniref:Uncharacterized protein n=1 Tax=Cardiocondyla obscurior TaxID=286306 RepID=A0AAW2F0V3_9HYME
MAPFASIYYASTTSNCLQHSGKKEKNPNPGIMCSLSHGVPASQGEPEPLGPHSIYPSLSLSLLVFFFLSLFLSTSSLSPFRSPFFYLFFSQSSFSSSRVSRTSRSRLTRFVRFE